MSLKSSRVLKFARTTIAVALWVAVQPMLRARAEDALNYTLLTSAEVTSLPRNRADLGVDVEQAQQTSAAGMTFAIIRVTRVHEGLAGAKAGLAMGDQIVAIDKRVFSDVAAFKAYVGSKTPDSQIDIDYIPGGRGPEQAQRANIVIGEEGPTSTSFGRLSHILPTKWHIFH